MHTVPKLIGKTDPVTDAAVYVWRLCASNLHMYYCICSIRDRLGCYAEIYNSFWDSACTEWLYIPLRAAVVYSYHVTGTNIPDVLFRCNILS